MTTRNEKVWLLYVESDDEGDCDCMVETIIGLHRKPEGAKKEKDLYYKNRKDVKIMPIILEYDEDLK